MMNTITERQDFFKKFRFDGTEPEVRWETPTRYQVIISAYNAEEWIVDVLESIEQAMRFEQWIMLFGDDASTDNTLSLVNEFKKKSSADEFKIYDFEKAENVSKAKNRIIKESIENFDRYKGIVLSDADDLMGLARVKGLYRVAKENNALLTVGSWTYCVKGDEKLRPATKTLEAINFGPWATLMHSNLVPDCGKLFYEGVSIHEDLILWREVGVAGLLVYPADNVNACFYNARTGTLSKPKDLDERKKLWKGHLDFIEKNNLLLPKEKDDDNMPSDDEILSWIQPPEGYVVTKVDPKETLKELRIPGKHPLEK